MSEARERATSVAVVYDHQHRGGAHFLDVCVGEPFNERFLIDAIKIDDECAALPPRLIIVNELKERYGHAYWYDVHYVRHEGASLSMAGKTRR